MDSVLNVLRRAAAIVIAIVTALTSLRFGENFRSNKNPDALLTVAMVADTHITRALYRRAIFLPGLRDLSAHVRPDVFLCAGDCTDNGNDANWRAFQGMLDRHLPDPERIIALGNHDTWTSYDTPHLYTDARDNFLRYAGEMMGMQLEAVWFTREIGGYPFIVMGSEDTSVGAVIGDAQLDWLAQAMADAAAAHAGKPIFVINHQPLNFSHTAGDNEHGNGYESNEASTRVREILGQYDNVFYISGHQHYNLSADDTGEIEGFRTVEQIGSITSINLPSYEYGTFLTVGTGLLGQGIVMEICADRVILRGRNFFLANWQKDFTVELPLAQ